MCRGLEQVKRDPKGEDDWLKDEGGGSGGGGGGGEEKKYAETSRASAL